jgi:hypothetical protein
MTTLRGSVERNIVDKPIVSSEPPILQCLHLIHVNHPQMEACLNDVRQNALKYSHFTHVIMIRTRTEAFCNERWCAIAFKGGRNVYC